ncbi:MULTISPECIES: molybdopterin cofactor-binding domain-containing protein [unclassified Mesorhizobium]|uniref:xanthine dehydrogenase family protein molybdopterin-binding subunit n=1 Tax=unclassified Mesorhizobium TaxID=325217 RepID=UPI0032B16A32
MKLAALAGAGLLVGFRFDGGGDALAATAGNVPYEPNAFIRIRPDGMVNLIIPSVEMGQGIYTGLATLIAEELEVDLDQVSVEAAPPDASSYANPLLHVQATGASTSTRAWWMPLRLAGASARAQLVAAAAQVWNADLSDCKAQRGSVVHFATGRSINYGALVDVAARLPPAKEVPLKEPKDFRLIGKALKRLDTPDKVNGRARFSIDVSVPNMKVATLAASPVFGGRVVQVDDSRAKAVPGVRQVVVLEDLVAVVGDHMWAAKLGLEALDITWDDGPHGNLSSADIVHDLEVASQSSGIVALAQGNIETAVGKEIEAVYQLPFLAHASLEPMNYTVSVTSDKCEIWGATQVIGIAQGVAAKLTGLPIEKVIIHNQLLGGGFGRRLEVDGIEKAVRIARHVDGPVKVIWTREEDIQQERYRPYYYDRVFAKLGADGLPISLHHRVTGSSVAARFAPGQLRADGLDPDAVDGSVDAPYEIPNRMVEFVRREPPAITTAFWRGVGAGHNVFVIESFIDELAHQAQRDPVEYRQALIGKIPRLNHVLNLAADKAGWGQPMAPGFGRGVAIQTTFNTYMAQVAEVQVDANGFTRVHRVTCAIDCGIVINPDTVIAQAQGGIIFGITAALYGEITLENGRVQQSNFNDYRMLRINEAPAVDVHLVSSFEPPGGIGEAGTVGAPAAVANAIFAATGMRFRELPIVPSLFAMKST